jgi:hypothetical protein
VFITGGVSILFDELGELRKTVLLLLLLILFWGYAGVLDGKNGWKYEG